LANLTTLTFTIPIFCQCVSPNTDQDGIRDANEQFTYTDTLGNYTFDLAPGTYRIAQELQRGWTQTNPLNPIYRDVTIVAGDVKFSQDFANTNNRLAGANVDPEFISLPPTAPIKTGGRLIYQAAATDLNGDPLSYDLVVNPEGMTISPDGTLSWVPGNEQLGQHQVIIRVKDDRGGIALQAFQVRVDQGNRLPIFTSTLPTVNPRVGQAFQFQAKAIDLDGDTVTYQIVNDPRTTPAGVTIDPATGLVKWTPNAQQVGGAFVWAYGSNATEPWEVLIRATDGKGGESFQRLRLTVEATGGTGANQAPVITSKPRTLAGTDRPYVYEIEANDPDGDRLSYELLPGAPAGMTLTGRTVTWAPTVAQLGSQSFQVKVSDGRGGFVTQNVPLLVSNQVANNAPMITDSPSVKRDVEEQAGFLTTLTEIDPPPQKAIAGQIYAYDFKGVDRDGDIVAWALLQAPAGMVIDSVTGALRWQPNLNQISGAGFDVVVALTDVNGATDTVTFKLIVNGTNLPPQITSSPLTTIAAGQIYQYAVQAKDPENGLLRYALNAPPIGMAIDAQSGIITWNPAAGQVGNHDVAVTVSDALGATVTQVYTLKVLTATDPQGNRAPVISSSPVFLTEPNKPYTYQVVATDPDNGAVLTYSLVKAPQGMAIDVNTGKITWAPSLAEAGTHEVIVKVLDQFGLGVGQGYVLNVRSNAAPVIISTSPNRVALGSTYRYDVRATDADRDGLTYRLDQASINRGVTIDELGRIRWTPTTTGAAPITITVTDVLGATATEDVNLNVVADTEAPRVFVRATSQELTIGQSVTFEVKAVDNVAVTQLKLMVNGQPVALDGQGQATMTFATAQRVEATAFAFDAANLQGTSPLVVVQVFDPNASPFNPSLTFNLPPVVTAPIKFNLSDESITRYKLDVISVATGEVTTLVSERPITTANQEVTFDPSLLLNDTYDVQLTVFGANGAKQFFDTVSVEGELKLGNFRLSFTDLAVPVTGIPITLTRTYDTLSANQQDDFGYGWRMEFRDTDLRTSLGQPNGDEVLLGRYPAFKDDTKVFITLPGGKREAFTFKAKPVETLQDGTDRVGTANFAKYFFEATFKAEPGSTNTLTVESGFFSKGENGKYYGFQGQPFNPADSLFGGVYVLTSKDGTKYRIDAATGDLLTVQDTNGKP
jgi:hypothetical protein